MDATRALSAHDVARELRFRLHDIGDVRLHKLLYFAQGIYLAWLGRPLFGETIEAWAMGPVVVDLWLDEKYGRPAPSSRSVDTGRLSVLDHVIGRYGKMTSRELIQLTHTDGGPWCQVTESETQRLSRSPEIPLDLLGEWFSKDSELASLRSRTEHLRDIWTEGLAGDSAHGSSLAQAITETLVRGPVWETRPA